MNATKAAPELACVPGAIPAAERQSHFALARDLFEQRATERIALPDGYLVSFPPDALRDVARFVANERKCCPFVTFDLTLGPDFAPLRLRMTGPEGTRAVLDAELNLPSSCCCG